MEEQTGTTSDYVGKILSEKRKAKKPLMEKMRRARINDSLNDLKFLVLDALNKDVSRYSKMEKADVLEMAVQHLRELKRMEKKHQNAANVAEYRTAISQCPAAEVSRNVHPCAEGSEQLRANLLSHFASSCYQGNYVKTAQAAPVVLTTHPVTWLTYPSPPPSPMGGYPTTSELLEREAVRCKSSVYKPERKSTALPTDNSVPLWRPWCR